MSFEPEFQAGVKDEFPDMEYQEHHSAYPDDVIAKVGDMKDGVCRVDQDD